MDGNLYLIEIIYLVFYALLASLYLPELYVAITNFSESYKIIIENASPQCLPKPQNLTICFGIRFNSMQRNYRIIREKTHVSKPYYYYNQRQ